MIHYVMTVDSLHYRLTFDLDNKNEIPGKNLLKVVKLKNLVECAENIALHASVTCGNCYHFQFKNGNNFHT